jgi:hypothetical protein
MRRSEGHGARGLQEGFVEAEVAEPVRLRVRRRSGSLVWNAHIEDSQMISPKLHGASVADLLIGKLRLLGLHRFQIRPRNDLQSLATGEIHHL